MESPRNIVFFRSKIPGHFFFFFYKQPLDLLEKLLPVSLPPAFLALRKVMFFQLKEGVPPFFSSLGRRSVELAAAHPPPCLTRFLPQDLGPVMPRLFSLPRWFGHPLCHVPCRFFII